MPDKYGAYTKGGRCWNGAHRDKGQIVHAVPPTTHGGGHFDAAACGAKPIGRSYGWSESNDPINCPSCMKKIDKERS